jgi:hypothetical protein
MPPLTGLRNSLGPGNYKHGAPDGASRRPSQYVKEQARVPCTRVPSSSPKRDDAGQVNTGTRTVGPPCEDFSRGMEKALVRHYPYFWNHG